MINTWKTPLLVLAVLPMLAPVSLASTSVSIPVISGLMVDRGERLVQAVLPDLPPSAVRRLSFYSDKAMLALFDLANEDSVVGQNGATISNDTTDALRTSVERLIDAGGKANLDVEQVALFFAQEMKVRFSGPIPFIVQDSAGDLDATALFVGIADNRSTASAATDTNLMSLLNAEGASMGTTTDSAPVTAPVVEEEVVATNEDPVLQGILDRVVTSGGKRTIKIIRGDTLAAFAAVFYGDTLRYRTIFLANTDVMDTPNLLEVGLVITIPEG